MTFTTCAKVARAILVTCVGLWIVAPAGAQTPPIDSVSKLTLQGPADQSAAPAVTDGLGRPCVDIEAAAIAQIINPEMLDHVVSLKNNCPRIIHAKVCYFNSDHCNSVVLYGYKRADVILGSMRGIKFFRYTVFQR